MRGSIGVSMIIRSWPMKGRYPVTTQTDKECVQKHQNCLVILYIVFQQSKNILLTNTLIIVYLKQTQMGFKSTLLEANL
jgi:hypothetical protein